MRTDRAPFHAILFALVLLVTQAAAGLAQTGKLMPVDEAARDPELFAFRARLQAALARHDAAAVLDMVDPKIKNTFGGDDGIEAFQRLWKLKEGDSRLWEELGLVLALGGTFQNADNFVAPYVYSRWPESVDSFENVAVLGRNVRVRAEPRAGSAVLASLSFDLVGVSVPGREKMTPEQARDWTAVKLRDGRTGYVSSRYVRSPVAHRAFLTRANGSWKLTFFVAGD